MFEEVPVSEVVLAFIVGLRFDLLVLAFLILPMIILAPGALLFSRGSRVPSWLVSFFLGSMWTLIVAMAAVDFCYFSATGRRVSSMAWASLGGFNQVRQALSGLPTETVLLNGGTMLCIWWVGLRLRDPIRSGVLRAQLNRSFHWGKWLLSLVLVALAARGTVTAHHLGWGHAKVSSRRVVQELAINPLWSWDKNPARR